MTSCSENCKSGKDTILEEKELTIEGGSLDFLEDFIKNIIAKELSINVSEVDVNQSFMEIGVTSIMSLAIRSSIEKKLGFAISSTILFNYNTIKNISDYLVLAVDNNKNIEESDEIVFHSEVEAEYDYYSEEELFELLKNELGGEGDEC